MKYITLFSTKNTLLLNLLNDPKYDDYEVITIFKDNTESHIAYLQRKPSVTIAPAVTPTDIKKGKVNAK